MSHTWDFIILLFYFRARLAVLRDCLIPGITPDLMEDHKRSKTPFTVLSLSFHIPPYYYSSCMRICLIYLYNKSLKFFFFLTFFLLGGLLSSAQKVWRVMPGDAQLSTVEFTAQAQPCSEDPMVLEIKFRALICQACTLVFEHLTDFVKRTRFFAKKSLQNKYNVQQKEILESKMQFSFGIQWMGHCLEVRFINKSFSIKY